MSLVKYMKLLNEGGEINTAANLGYVYIPNSIRRCLRLSQEEKLVLFEIYSLYNEDKGYAFPTQQTLAMYVGVSSSSISKALKKLEEKGFIKSSGRKGKKKRYYPQFNIHLNPYLVLSETFHFATKVINKWLEEDIGGDWGNKLLQLVNSNKNLEFTEEDAYGTIISNFKMQASIDELLSLITGYVSQLCSRELNINWNEEIAENYKNLEERKKTKENPVFDKKSKKKSLSDYEEQDAINGWMRQMGIED